MTTVAPKKPRQVNNPGHGDDAAGNRLRQTDARGNVMEQTAVIDGSPWVTRYAYNSADQLIQMTYPSGRTVDYARNALGQVSEVASAMDLIATNGSYAPYGPRTGLGHGNGMNEQREYDLDYRLTRLTTTGLGLNRERRYTYDPADNIDAIEDWMSPDKTQDFGYDERNRLTLASGPYGALSYSYDANGNRLTATTNGVLATYTYSLDRHHLLQTDDGNLQSYQYDANGNTVDNTSHQFFYGDNNRLRTVSTLGTPIATYTYNGRGERVKKAGATITYYQYDLDGQLLAEMDDFGNTLKEYIYLDGTLLALIEGGIIYSIHTDHLGTPQVISDTNQNIVWEADYKPFGEATITTEFITNNLRFPGQYIDAETGMHYNYFRDYDPATGRYIQSDPIGLAGGLNTYNYVSGNPVKLTDPQGLAIPVVIAVCLADPPCAYALAAGAVATGKIIGDMISSMVSGGDNVISFPGAKDDTANQCPTGDGGGLCNLVTEAKVRDIPFNDPIAKDYPVPGLKEWRCEYYCPKSGRTIIKTVINANLGCLQQITDPGF